MKERDRVFGIDTYTLLYLKWITNKNLLYIKHRELCSMLYGSLDGKEFGGEWIHACIYG